LNDLAGAGNSTISYTVAREYNKQKRLGGSFFFFFSKGAGNVSRANTFFTTLTTNLRLPWHLSKFISVMFWGKGFILQNFPLTPKLFHMFFFASKRRKS
jgi:hypothetical protein